MSLKVFGLSLAGLRVWLALAVRATVVAGGLTARVAAGADVLSISQSRHSLEDVYLELIDHDKEASRRKEASRG